MLTFYVEREPIALLQSNYTYKSQKRRCFLWLDNFGMFA